MWVVLGVVFALVFHPLGDVGLQPDDGLAHARHLKHLYKTQETGLSSMA